MRKPALQRTGLASLAIVVAIGAVLVGAADFPQKTTRDDHIAWAGDALKRMETIKPGMTRKELLVVFTTEGGISSALHRTFVSRDCPYFKVDVEFEAVVRPQGQGGRLVEGSQDRIAKISRPYLQFSIFD